MHAPGLRSGAGYGRRPSPAGMRALAFLSTVIVVAFVSCTKISTPTLPREELFSLGLGNMENQIDLFMVDGRPLNRSNLIYVKGGRIYIVNGNASKIMEFTPFGDLVFLLYNAEVNPQPVILKPVAAGADEPNRRAQGYALADPGVMAVDGEKRLYVEDRVGPLRGRFDESTGTTHYAHVLRFDRDGKLIDYLGQEGAGGTPFPFIDAIRITAHDEPVVVCRVPPARWIVYWFTREGSLLYRVEFDRDYLPAPQDTLPFLEAIFADYSRRELLLAVSYYREEINASTRTPETWLHVGTRIHRFDIARAEYVGQVDVPDAGMRRERVGASELEIPSPPFEFLGNTRNGYLFFLKPEEANAYQLLVLDARGREHARRLITVEDKELSFKKLTLSEEGVLAALLGLNDGARVVWWRADRLIEGAGDARR